MSKPFYNHIANQLSDYFKQEVKQGIVTRYFLSLPSEMYVKHVIEALHVLPEATKFTCSIPGSSEFYTTNALTYANHTYVIATTVDGTHIDFIVTLRNLMSEQKGEWKNTSLIVIADNLLDSISGGSKDLTSEGMPLHASQMVSNLEEHVNTSSLKAQDKEVLIHYLKQTESRYYLEQTSFLDYEEVLTWCNSETIAEEEYKELGYFKDSALNGLLQQRDQETENSGKYKQIQKKIDARLSENMEMFDEVSRLRELGNGEERLVNLFDNLGKKLFKDEDNIDLADIIKAREKVLESKDITFKEEDIVILRKATDSKVKTFWRKSPKKRMYELIIFLEDYVAAEEIEIKLPFTRTTSESYILKRSAQFVTAKGHSLYANIQLNEGNVTFKNISYRHDNMSTSAFTFRILIIKESAEWLKNFELNYGLASSGHLHINLSEDQIQFGNGEEEIVVEKEYDTVTVHQGAKISFKPGVLDEDTTSIKFNVRHNDCVLPIEVSDKEFKTKDISSIRIWKEKMNLRESFNFTADARKVNIGQQPYKISETQQEFYLLEKQWLDENLFCADYHLTNLTQVPLELPARVESTYLAYLQALKMRGTIPSFTYYDEALCTVAKDYIKAYVEEVRSIQDNDHLSVAQKNLLSLGAMYMNDTIYMTPFSPLNVAYQLEMMKAVDGQLLDENIVKRLKPAHVLPYFINPRKDQYLKPDSLNTFAEWHCYQPQNEVQIGETNAYLASLIKEKLKQFVTYYDYLFAISSKPKMYINIINLSNDKEILKGILKWYKERITQTGSLNDLFELELISYEQSLHTTSAFELFNTLSTAAEVKEMFDVDCATKQFDAEDVLLEIQRHLSYFKVSIEEEPRYSHITFYKMQNKEHMSKQIIQNAPNAMNLDGLFVSTTSQRTENGGYRVGFGVGTSDTNRTLLTQFAVVMNELTANNNNYGRDPYKKNNVISLHIDEDDESYLQKLYNSTTWLTFIDPAVDLRYFQESSENLVIVHYSDQLSSSSKYDAITVTDKSTQYFNVIDGFLESEGIKVPSKNIDQIIKSFNTFNGEWLLRAVQNQGHDKREKMSIVAAIKHALINLEKDTITWVPVSMEEIVRVAGNIRLNRKDGIFSGMTIGKTGNCSDDLLLIGLEVAEDIKLHLYPVEVKIGYNNNDVIEKGINQVRELNRRLTEFLIDDASFNAKFLRNFFARMYIINANKMKLNEFWPEKNYDLDEAVLEKLLNDDFTLSDELVAENGIGAIMSFKKQLIKQTRKRDKGVVIYEIPEDIAYKSLGASMEKLKGNDFSEVEEIEIEPTAEVSLPAKLPTTLVIPTVEEPVILEQLAVQVKDSEPSIEEKYQVVSADEIQAEQKPIEESLEPTRVEVEVQQPDEVASTKAEQVIAKRKEPLFGYQNEEPIYWEYSSTNLSNRHLVIGGKSGQGKTYFIQSVLIQLIAQGQSALIIDFSSSYTQSQLNPKFLNVVGDRLEERIVYYEGFPINPFKRREKLIAGKTFLEKETDTAARIQNVFTSVYNFGPQQESAIYRAAKKCIEMYGEKATMELMLEVLQDLPDTSAGVIATVISKLSIFVDIDPFDYNSDFTWDDYFLEDGKVFIIQFEGFDQDDTKKLMTEFILWDLLSYAQAGNVNKPLPIILDEAQNLDFSSNSPSEKILREGRKFGLSAWFATQTFSNFNQAERTVLENAATSIFFKPAESELNLVAKKMDITNLDELRNLQKGECIIQGQFMEGDILGDPKSVRIKVPEIK